jgi:predicted AAA+ superfamily ATPase
LKRKVIDELINWKTDTKDTPILLTGAKGVGKTYLAYDFAKSFFEQFYYINFEREPMQARIFQGSNNEMLGDRLLNYFGITEEFPSNSRILILDEISFCEEALVAIKEHRLTEAFEYILVITSHPLAQEFEALFRRICVHPLEFDEFLRATNNEWYIETILNHFNSSSKVPDIVHKELLALHQLYLQIGGMPGIVNEYLNLSDTVNVSEQHSFIIGSYHDFIFRDNADSDALKMKQVLDSLIYQLMKENKKFQYKIIRKGTTHAMYRDAIKKLVEQNYVIRSNKMNTELLVNPTQLSILNNSCEEDNSNFKLYLPDTGLLYSKIVEEQGSEGITIHQRALIENYVAQSLQAKNYPFAFWESESMAKVDFIITKNLDMIPIEIFLGENTRSKSISVLKQKCEFPYAIKISAKNFEYSNQIKYVPYYAVFCL